MLNTWIVLQAVVAALAAVTVWLLIIGVICDRLPARFARRDLTHRRRHRARHL